MEAATSRGAGAPSATGGATAWPTWAMAPLAAKICKRLEADQLADYLFSTIYDRSGTIHLQFLFVGADVL